MSMDRRQKDAERRLRLSERVQIRISPETAEYVIEEAHKQRRTVADMLRVIIEEWVDEQGRRQP